MNFNETSFWDSQLEFKFNFLIIKIVDDHKANRNLIILQCFIIVSHVGSF